MNDRKSTMATTGVISLVCLIVIWLDMDGLKTVLAAISSIKAITVIAFVVLIPAGGLFIAGLRNRL